MKVKTIAKTCSACPSQWEGHLEDGRMFYARYRWGRLTVAVSDEPTDDVFVAVDGELAVDVMLGDPYDGSLGYADLHSQMVLAGFSFGNLVDAQFIAK